MICFFLFLFFAILSEKGLLTSSLQGPSEEARSKLSRPLSIRADALRAAVRYINNHIDKNKKIAGSYGNALIDVTLWLGCIIRSSLELHNIIKLQYAFGTLVSSARYLESETSDYFANNFFSSVSLRNRDKLLLL